MKKTISVVLSLVMLFGILALPTAAAQNEHEKCPVIFIAGSSVDICDAEGNVIPTGFDVLTDDDGGDSISKEKIIESSINIILPFVAEGLAEDEWENYGNALYEELAPIWDETQLGGDGNAKYGTGVSAAEIKQWDDNALKNHGADGKFAMWDYMFRYDWRLSPYDHVDRLHEYIKTIITTTGCDQVALMGRCLGGNIINAYLDVYGSEKLVKKVVYDEVMSNGSATVNDCFSGKIEFSDRHIQAYILQSEYFGKYNIGIDIADVNDLLLEIATGLLDVLTQTGAADAIYDSVYDLYERLCEAFMPAMLRATGIGTWVSYWASVCDDDFDTALNLVFGEEGSELREENKGLIDKINRVRTNLVKPRELKGDDNLYKIFEKEYGVKIAVISSYGLVNPPITESSDLTGDCTVDTKNSSFGATVAGVFDTLPEMYVDLQIASGKGEYISPDKKIDASTCLFPETTWFIKNNHHDTYSPVERIAEFFTQYKDVRVNDNSRNISRFLVIKENTVGEAVNMTEENCGDGPWLSEVTQKPSVETIVITAIRLLTAVFTLLTQLLEGTFML